MEAVIQEALPVVEPVEIEAATAATPVAVKEEEHRSSNPCSRSRSMRLT